MTGLMTANLASSLGTLRGNYVLLKADALQLLLPQHEVGAAEYLAGAPQPSAQTGVFEGEGGRRYAALSQQLSLLPHYPAGRFLAIPIGDDGDGHLWCWNELRVLIDAELEIHALPAVLVTPNAPVQHYAEIDGSPAYLCSARQLRSFALAPGN